MSLKVIESILSTSRDGKSEEIDEDLNPYKVYKDLHEKTVSLHKHFDRKKKMLQVRYRNEKAQSSKKIKQNFIKKYESMVRSLYFN